MIPSLVDRCACSCWKGRHRCRCSDSVDVVAAAEILRRSNNGLSMLRSPQVLCFPCVKFASSWIYTDEWMREHLVNRNGDYAASSVKLTPRWPGRSWIAQQKELNRDVTRRQRQWPRRPTAWNIGIEANATMGGIRLRRVFCIIGQRWRCSCFAPRCLVSACYYM